MPVQKTFTIVPTGAGLAGDGPTAAARPMTSKQVRKAYKAANKAPSMSRAERLRWERAEQERIRRELDKERAAAKAKAARERKKAKEEAEREMKKRRRLPLVSVRPSQDTISRFARAKPPRGLPTVEEEAESLGTIPEETPDAESQRGTLGTIAKDPPDADLLFDGDDFELELLALEVMTQQQTPKSAVASHPHRGRDSLTSLDPPPAKPPDSRSSPISQPQPPPLSTQAIFSNLDDFFPTSTQLEVELEEERGALVKAPPSSSDKENRAPRTVPDKCFSILDDFFPTSTQLELELEEDKRTAGTQLVKTRRVPAPPGSSDKENRAPAVPAKWSVFTASQESYGGDWVDEAALELLI